MKTPPIISILRSLVQNTPPVFSQPLDLGQLCRHMNEQNLCAIVAYADKLWHFIDDPALSRSLNMKFYSTVTRNLNRCEAFRKLSEQLTRAGIVHMPVKGYYLRNLYPVPELRSFGDIDVLIHPEDRAQTDTLMRELGYTAAQSWEPTYTYTRGMEYYELHTNLMDGNLDGRTDLCAYFASAWDHARSTGGLCFQPDLEFHLIYIICHLAKHLYHGGAGLRMYLDVALYLRHLDEQINWDLVCAEFERLRLTDFFHTVMQAACRWFGVETVCPLPQADEALLDELLTYTLDADLFGHLRDHAVVELRNEQKPSKSGLLKRMLFPPAEQIKARYTFLEKRPWLLPLAWIARFFANLKLLPQRLQDMKNISRTDSSAVSSYDAFMNRLGL